ncbi:hypothetical protein [Spirochaeta thermophila]|uniref:hypothetical protein n=1 Tax=Winmispira thermophila TaxID=154 RepID=UPI0013051F54|nr:hypothetical protein [Spirochaeta thermophila]
MKHKHVPALLKEKSLPGGAAAIKYWSEKNPGGVCYAVKDPSILRFEGVYYIGGLE